MPATPRLFVVSGPSGAGKGTLLSLVRESRPDLALTVSATTRKPRKGEIDGVSYRFLSDEDFDADDYLSAPGSTDIDTPAPDDYSDIEIDHNPTYDTFTVHAYVPDSWGYPGCWAWSNTTGENVFDAWPGEPMDHVSGYYYTLEIPAWAEYVIVNGNDGTIQTQDEPVEPGSDVWVVISAIDETYNVYFSEPSADELAAFGY